MILLTGFYLDPEPARRREILACLSRNAMNDVIEEVHVLAEPPVDPSDLVASLSPAIRSKLRVVQHHGRPTFQSLFSYANAQPLVGGPFIVANADIYFDASLRRLQNLDLSGRLLCLSRWDVQADGSARFFEHPASQDAWVFQSPIRAFRCDFPLGVPACDNRLAWEAEHAGLLVSNPSRSVRANHLHLSGVHRYTERERLPGPTRAVPAELLGTPWLWFVLSAVKRATGLNETLASLAKQSCSYCIVVGGLLADSLNTWVSENYPAVSVLAADTASPATVGQAWNRGAAAVEDGGIICFLDSGTVAEPGFSEHVLSGFERDQFLTSDCSAYNYAEAVVCSKANFASIGGFDETIVNPDRACTDLRAALLRADVRPGSFCENFLSRIGPGEMSASESERVQPVERDPLAVVAFRETMGYTIARLTLGASSHNNDLRPFDAVPDILIGRVFTQAVASSVSPVEIHFLRAGKLYVLVGTDWDGYHPATAWLSARGTRELLPLATTARGTGFEIWSLQGSANEKLVIPTQIVLVGDGFCRRDPM